MVGESQLFDHQGSGCGLRHINTPYSKAWQVESSPQKVQPPPRASLKGASWLSRGQARNVSTWWLVSLTTVRNTLHSKFHSSQNLLSCFTPCYNDVLDSNMQQFTNSIACYMQLGLYKSTLNLSDFACSYFTSCVPPTPLQSSEWILLPFVLAWFIILNRQIIGSVKIKIYKQPQGGSEASGWVQAIKALKFRRHIFQSLSLHFCLEVICCSNALYLKDVWFVYNLKGSTLNYTQYEQKHLLREWDLNHRVLDKLLEIKLQRLFQILLDWGEGRGGVWKIQ